MGKTNRMYKNKDREKSLKYIERRNEIIIYRLFILFGITSLVVGFFVFAMNINMNEINRLSAISASFFIFTGILFTLSAVFLVYRVKHNIDESDKIIHSKNIFAVTSFLLIIAATVFFTDQYWIPFMTAFTISVTILVYIYYLYQKEFFLFSLFAAMGCFFLYFAESQILPVYWRIFFRLLLAALSVFIFIFPFPLKKNSGRLRIKSFEIKILEKNSKYFQFFILAGFIAGFAVVSFVSFFPANFFYLIYALLACFIIAGIYFTVKMI